MQQQQLAISRISKTVLVGNPMKQHVCKSIVAAIALASVSFLSGCASGLNTASTSDFACDESRNCPTPLEVYGRTNTVPSSVKNGRTPTSWQHTTPRKGDVKEGEGGERADLRLDLVKVAPSSQLVVAADPPAQPLREPSQVMRIWIAPWIDQSDNLNWSGYVYTEVTSKRWAIGEQEVRQQGLAPQFLPR